MKRLNALKRPVRFAFHRAIKICVPLYEDKYRYVFVLAHMRSGSTLLSHILGGHPEFAGAGETFVTYRTPADFSNLVAATCQMLHKLKLNAAYIVDQINHNRLLTNEVLSSPRIHKCVILIRSPKTSLQSIVQLRGLQEKVALDYYTDRLDGLIKYGLHLGERAMLVEYDDLVDHTEKTLADLTDFFGVTEPFKPRYATRRTTGILGDPSSNIWAGRVIRTQSHRITIGAEALAQALMAFQKCRQQLRSAGVRPANESRPSLPVALGESVYATEITRDAQPLTQGVY